MLCWFVDRNIAVQAMHKEIVIEEDKVEVHPERVPMKCLDENVSINLIRKYFTFDAWKQVEMLMNVLKEKGCWNCIKCSAPLSNSESIGCDSCLDWFHLTCIGMRNPPKRKVWFCRACHT